MSAHIDAIKRHIVQKICDDRVNAFKITISNIVSDPVKLNKAQALASLIYRSKFDIDDLQLNNIEFNDLKSHYSDLQGQLGIVFKECATVYNTPGQFFYEVLKDNKDFLEFIDILEIAVNDGIGESEISFFLDEDKLRTIDIILGKDLHEQFE